MKHPRLRWILGPVQVMFALWMVMSSGIQAQQADVSSSVTLPDEIWLGTPFTVTIGYANNGPYAATEMYPNGEFVPPMGLDVFLDNTFNGDGSMFEDLKDSATDSLGNVPLLFWDDFYCETASFQVQGDDQDDATPIAPLGAGEGGSFSFETAFPMDSPRSGAVEINAPEYLEKTWTLSDPSNFFIGHGYATTFSVYATTTCEQLVGDPEDDVCRYIGDNCWGTKVSHLSEPIVAEFVLVDDGSADPTLGCSPIVNDVVGKIAVFERGSCEFGEKGLYAEQAGAAGVFMVNSTLCSPPDFPDSDQCVINMGPGALGALVSIPVVMVSRADGADLLDALGNGETVSGVFGSASIFAAQGWAYHGGASSNTDPDDSNDVSLVKTPTADRGLDHSPTDPEIGQVVLMSLYGFTDDLRVDWDFGEDGCMPDHPQEQQCLPSYTNCHQIAHKFSSAGQKTVTAEIYDDTDTYLGTVTETITVEDAGFCGSDLPINFTISDTTPDIGQWVGFHVTGIQPDDIESAVWDFGGIGCDGSLSYTCTQGGGPISCDQAAFAYETGGSKIITLTVTSVSAGVQEPVQHALVVSYSGSCGGGTCTYSISPTSRDFSSGGGAGTVSVTTQGGCSWSAVEGVAWINVTSGSSGLGSGTASYSVAPNTGEFRSGTITIAGKTHTVNQQAGSPIFEDGFESGDTGAWSAAVP